MARKPKLDAVLAEAVDTARLALAEIADDSEIGEHLGAAIEDERLVTHRFVAHREGYRGWTWFVTLARIPRAKAKDATVCEVGIIPGHGALLAPAWVPWAERLAQEEIEAAQQSAEQSEVEGDDNGAGTGDESITGADAVTDEADGSDEAEDEPGSEIPDVNEQPAEPGRRPVRRRRTAQRTAARRRAAARNRARKPE